MCFGGGGGAAEDMARQQRADEQARQRRVRQGMTQIDNIFSRFNDKFYGDRAKAYVDYATPSLERQAGDAREKLIYALSRTGNLDSSAANDLNRDLGMEMDEARIGIANEGQDVANRTRANVEDVRSNLVAQLNATGDSSAASAAALRQARDLSMPQGFSPLGTLFAGFANTLASIGSRADNNFSGFLGGGRALFGAPSGSQRVVGAGG